MILYPEGPAAMLGTWAPFFLNKWSAYCLCPELNTEGMIKIASTSLHFSRHTLNHS